MLESFKWEEKVRLVQNDPVTCARYFQQLSFNFTLSIIIASITLLTYVEVRSTLIITTFMVLTLISTTTTRHLLTNIEVISTLLAWLINHLGMLHRQHQLLMLFGLMAMYHSEQDCVALEYGYSLERILTGKQSQWPPKSKY